MKHRNDYNRGQSPLGQMILSSKEVFPVCKLLCSIPKPRPPPLQCWLLEEDILVNSSMTSSSAFNIAVGGGGLSSKFPPKNEEVSSVQADSSG